MPHRTTEIAEAMRHGDLLESYTKWRHDDADDSTPWVYMGITPAEFQEFQQRLASEQ